MIIEFGALAKPLKEQLKNTCVPVKVLTTLDDVSKSLTKLYIKGFLTDGEVKRARKRIIKKIEKSLQC
jgi:hypothetical protein